MHRQRSCGSGTGAGTGIGFGIGIGTDIGMGSRMGSRMGIGMDIDTGIGTGIGTGTGFDDKAQYIFIQGVHRMGSNPRRETEGAGLGKKSFGMGNILVPKPENLYK